MQEGNRHQGDQKRKCAKVPRCKKTPGSKKIKFITVCRSGQGQSIKPEKKNRKEMAYKNQQKPWGKMLPMDKENEREGEPSIVLRRWRNGMPNQAGQEQRHMLTSICRQHKPQLMLEKHFTVPEERISSGTWYNFFPFWIQNRCTFK